MSAEKSRSQLLAESKLFGLQRVYQEVLSEEAPQVEMVLADLKRFCRASESCFHPDPRIHAMLEGRREVWLHIERFLKLSSQDLWNHTVRVIADNAK